MSDLTVYGVTFRAVFMLPMRLKKWVPQLPVPILLKGEEKYLTTINDQALTVPVKG